MKIEELRDSIDKWLESSISIQDQDGNPSEEKKEFSMSLIKGTMGLLQYYSMTCMFLCEESEEKTINEMADKFYILLSMEMNYSDFIVQVMMFHHNILKNIRSLINGKIDYVNTVIEINNSTIH